MGRVRRLVQTQAEFIRQGDRFVAEGYRRWEALGDAEIDGGLAIVEVVYSDGGRASRAWEPWVPLEVERMVWD